MNNTMRILELLCTGTSNALVVAKAPELAAKRCFWLHELRDRLQLSEIEVLNSCQDLQMDDYVRTEFGEVTSMNQSIYATKQGRKRWKTFSQEREDVAESQKPLDREQVMSKLMSKPIWEEADVAAFFDVSIDALRHMKSRNEIPAIVQTNLRTWHIHRDAFLEHFKREGMPKNSAGRPRGSKTMA